MRHGAIFVWLVMAVFLMPTSVCAEVYFEHCATVVSKPSFKALAAYLTPYLETLGLPGAGDHAPTGGDCFRLNDHEFVVLETINSGIFHCEFKNDNKCTKYEDPQVFVWQDPTVIKEFTDLSGKHFVLLEQENLEHGVFTQTIAALYLVVPSKDTDNLPFTIQTLVSTSLHNDTGDMTNDPCGWSNPEAPRNVPETVDGIGPLYIGSDRMGHATVTFRMTENTCDTGKTASFHRIFDFSDGRFVDASTDLPKPDVVRFVEPNGLAVDSLGSLFVSRLHHNSILKVDSKGRLSVLIEGADGGSGSASLEASQFMAVANDGSLLMTDARHDAIHRVSRAGRVSTLRVASVLGSPEGVAIDQAANVYIACDDHAVRKITPSGIVTILAGGRKGDADGLGQQASFSNIDIIALGPAGEVYVSDPANHAVRKIMPDGTVSTLISGDSRFSVFEVPDGIFYLAHGLAVSKDGTVYATSGNTIFKIASSGTATVAAGGSAGFSDGAASVAQFRDPTELAFDSDGNLFVLDEGNEAIREIWADGHVTTLIARHKPPSMAGSAH